MNKEQTKELLARTVCLWHIGKPSMWDRGEDGGGWEGPPKKDYYEAADMIVTNLETQGVSL